MFNVQEFDELIGVVGTLVNVFSLIGDYLSTSINDILSNLGLAIELPGWAGGNLTPIVLMVGIGLPTYLGYQFVKWIIKVI